MIGESSSHAVGATASGEIELPGGGRALFTDRSQGNMSSVGGEQAGGGLLARERLRERCGVDALLRGYQVHGTVIGRVLADGARRQRSTVATALAGAAAGNGRASAGERADASAASEHDLANARAWRDSETQPSFRADGHATAATRVGAMVLAADCIPVVLGSQGAVAAVHAGWRGLAAGVLEQGVQALRDVGGVGEIVAVIGPCAGACCYEVGEQVHVSFGGAHRNGRLIDLRAIAHDRLRAAGVAEVLDVDVCTICDERYFSYRREGAGAGRQAAVAWLT